MKVKNIEKYTIQDLSNYVIDTHVIWDVMLCHRTSSCKHFRCAAFIQNVGKWSPNTVSLSCLLQYSAVLPWELQILYNCVTGKGKVILLQAWCGPEGG